MRTSVAVAVVGVVCAALLTVSVALAFNVYLQAREAQERKQYTDRMVSAVEQGIEKIPEFKLLNRKDKNASSSGNTRRFHRHFGS